VNDLRERLLALLSGALARLAECEVPDPGLLRVIADTAAVLRILDEVDVSVRVSHETREGK
jgi:hypothetical protein